MVFFSRKYSRRQSFHWPTGTARQSSKFTLEFPPNLKVISVASNVRQAIVAGFAEVPGPRRGPRRSFLALAPASAETILHHELPSRKMTRKPVFCNVKYPQREGGSLLQRGRVGIFEVLDLSRGRSKGYFATRFFSALAAIFPRRSLFMRMSNSSSETSSFRGS